MMDIKVLGQGCIGCEHLERDVINVLAEMDLAANLFKKYIQEEL